MTAIKHIQTSLDISKKKAVEELDNIMSSKLLVIEPVIEQDWEKSITYFRKYSDHQIDFKIHGFENLK